MQFAYMASEDSFGRNKCRLAHMWKTMLKCHQVQIHISQQLNHLPDYPSIDLSSEYKRQAVNQLETEVTCWYNSFCKLVNSQREYVKTLCTWIQLTDRLSIEDNQRSSLPVAARKLCKEWQLVFEKIPDKVLLLVAAYMYFSVYCSI